MGSKTGGDNDPLSEEYSGTVTEVGAQAVWSLSSCKPGNFRLSLVQKNMIFFDNLFNCLF